jgi:hypothetical protein
MTNDGMDENGAAGEGFDQELGVGLDGFIGEKNEVEFTRTGSNLVERPGRAAARGERVTGVMVMGVTGVESQGWGQMKIVHTS